MTYSFFVRFSLIGSVFDTDSDQLALASNGSESLWLEAIGALRDASELTLRGTGYETPGAAEQAGELGLAALKLAFIRTLTPADFLERVLMGGMSAEALTAAQEAIDSARTEDEGEQPRVVVVPRRAGVLAHPSDVQPISFRLTGTGTVTKSTSALADAYDAAVRQARVDAAASLAFDLWSASTRMPSIDARFLTLVNAIEALIEQRPIEGVELEAVQRLEALVDDCDLEAGSRASLRGRLEDFRRESIGRAGRRLSRRLDLERYDGKRASEFFTEIYDMRSRLTHGGEAPSHRGVADASVELDRFVRDLIANRLTSSLG
jgi:hypothetical protein